MATLTDTVPLFVGRESQQSSTPRRGRRPSCTDATRFPAGACKSVRDGLSLLSLIKLAGAAFALFLPALHAAQAQVPVKVVRFDDVTPPGVVLTMTFNAIGMDPQERVYITLCNGNTDCYLLRYDPKTNKRQYLGSLREAAKRDGNIGPNKYWNKNENITKGHTHVWYLDGKMWMGTMNAHDYNDMSVIRGGHLMAYDLATGIITDHSQWQPKGVFKDRGGFYALTTAPSKNLLIGIGVPRCEIITYNPSTRQTKHVQGLPVVDQPNISGRDAAVFADGDLLYQCGGATTPLGIYNINTGRNRATKLKLQSVLTNSIVVTGDGQKGYLADFQNIYEFDTRNDSLRRLTTLLPNGSSPEVWSLGLSRDEKKLYYVVQALHSGGPVNIDDLYEYNIRTGARTKLMNLKGALGGGAKISGNHVTLSNGKIYFGFHSYTGAGRGLLELDVSSRSGPAPTATTNDAEQQHQAKQIHLQ
jgi:hypothetical protein